MDITSSQLYIESIRNVTKNRTLPGQIYCQRRHSDCLVNILTGEADYFFGTKKMKAEKGNILYLSKNSTYRIEVTHPNYSNYYFDFDFFNSSKTDYDCNIYKSELLVPLETDFVNLYKKWQVASIADKVSCMSLVYGIYSVIIASSVRDYITPSRQTDMELAASIIRENIGNSDFSVSRIAKKLAVSEVHFRRLFGKIHGMSPVKYITFLRLEKAKEYLRNDNIPVSEIAQLCGFSSSYYFSRVFRADMGCTPSRYRESFLNGIM